MFEDFFKKAPVNDPEAENELKKVKEAQAREAALSQQENMEVLSEKAENLYGDDKEEDVDEKTLETIH